MADERAIERHQLQTFDLALGQQQAVERIARLRLWLRGGNHVAGFDRQQGKPERLQKRGNVVELFWL